MELLDILRLDRDVGAKGLDLDRVGCGATIDDDALDREGRDLRMGFAVNRLANLERARVGAEPQLTRVMIPLAPDMHEWGGAADLHRRDQPHSAVLKALQGQPYGGATGGTPRGRPLQPVPK